MTDAASCGTCRPEAISTEGLTKRYGDACVVDHVDLTVPERAVYGFLGPNGAGKSTTMKMLLGLTHPNEGTATVLGCPLLPENRLEVLRSVGSLIESPCCYPRLTARENLEIVRRLRGLPESEIDEALSIVGLDGPAARKKAAGNFSLGMRQRLGIAAPLMGKPPLLLLDEPTNGLDPSGIHEICSLVGSLPERFDVTVVVSSHLLRDRPDGRPRGHHRRRPHGVARRARRPPCHGTAVDRPEDHRQQARRTAPPGCPSR